MNKRNKSLVRVLALAVAALIVVSTLASALSFALNAAEEATGTATATAPTTADAATAAATSPTAAADPTTTIEPTTAPTDPTTATKPSEPTNPTDPTRPTSPSSNDGEIRANVLSATNGIRQNQRVTVRFTFSVWDSDLNVKVSEKEDINAGFFVSNSWWTVPNNAKMKIKVIEKADVTVDGETKEGWKFEATIDSIVYNATDKNTSLEIGRVWDLDDGREIPFFNQAIIMSIQDRYFSNSLTPSDSSSGTDDDTDTKHTPMIMVENAVALDSQGNRIDEVTKDTPTFTMEIVYADLGFYNRYEGFEDEISDGDIRAFFEGNASFEISDNARGTVRRVSGTWDYPRFRATFTGVKYTGVGKDVAFKIFYLFGDTEGTVSADGKTTLSAAKPEDEEDEDDKKMALAQPKIIISNYSYGEETIIAGSEFSLAFTITNTRSEIPLENAVITLSPASQEGEKEGPGLIVSASSNTIYLPTLAPGASQSYNISFKARADAAVTSHLINVNFSYEYIDTNLEERKTIADLSESIAIPVSQIDRFSIDPILETAYAQPDQETYVTVNMINRGKSTTNNISGIIRGLDKSITAPSQYFGHLEAGNSDTLDMYMTPTKPGEYTGEVVIQYEDENSDIKELSTPFSIYVEEPWNPGMDQEFNPGGDMGMMEPPAPQGPGALSVALCAIGGLAIAAPIALYLMKRVKAKGSEDFDEDF